MVECGGLENRFTGAPGDEGSNPSSSAILVEKAPNYGSFFVLSPLQTNTTEEEGFERASGAFLARRGRRKPTG